MLLCISDYNLEEVSYNFFFSTIKSQNSKSNIIAEITMVVTLKHELM